MRLLVCDDDVAVRMQLGIALDDVELHESFRVFGTVEQAREVRPDAVCIDQRLPDGDGLSIVRGLRADPITADCVVVVLSAGHDPAARATVLAAGADEYVPKPFDPVELRTLLHRLQAVPAGERRIRRTVQRARLHVGRDDGGTDDLPEVEAAAPGAPARRRWRRRA